MDVLGVIPARGGSKGIPHKNLTLLHGTPLLAYTCEQARLAKTLTRVILSTDDPAIASYAHEQSIEVPFTRPQELATDDTPMVEVVQHVLRALGAQGYLPDVVVVLQPTSPLRRATDIDEAVRLLVDSGADSVVSVVEIPHQFIPSSLFKLEEGTLVPYQAGPQPLRRQDKPILYARNGPAVLAVRSHVIAESRNLYGGVCRPLVMPWAVSVDIDGPEDLALAEYLLMQRVVL